MTASENRRTALVMVIVSLSVLSVVVFVWAYVVLPVFWPDGAPNISSLILSEVVLVVMYLLPFAFILRWARNQARAQRHRTNEEDSRHP